MFAALLIALGGALPLASGHASFFHKSMYGFNVTDKTFPYDNRPVSPLMNYTFEQWWFHGHLDYPPHPGDFFELPAGKPATAEIACNKGATTWFNSSEGGNIQNGNDVCPGSDMSEYHTTGFNDLKGCAMAIAYESDVTKIKPEDFTVFSINQTCVWTRFTDFQVPERMPPCPPGGCHCAWFWIHSQDSGGEQNYMTGFKCNVTGSTSNVPLAKPQVPRRCGADPDNGKPNAAPGNCTYGAKQPFYWFQAEQNNMFEGTYSPPFYLDLYNFKDGAQNDIFVDSYPNGLPAPSPNSTFVPTPFLGNGSAQPTDDAGVSASPSVAVPTSTAGSVSVSATVGSTSAVTSAISSETASTSSSSRASGTSTSTTFSASTLSPTASVSSSIASSSLSPELPLSTTSASLPSAASDSALATSEVVSTSVAVTTSTVISTLVVTVTADAPAASSSANALSSSASSFAVSTSSSVLSTTTNTFPSSAPVTSTSSTVQGFQTAGPSTIFLNRPTAATTSSPVASASGTQSSSIDADQAAPTTIALDFAAVSNNHSYSVKEAASPNVLAAAPSDGTCKRQFRRKVALRRRAAPSGASQTKPADEDNQEPTVLSRINVPGLKRHRKLQQRSSLWRLF